MFLNISKLQKAYKHWRNRRASQQFLIQSFGLYSKCLKRNYEKRKKLIVYDSTFLWGRCGGGGSQGAGGGGGAGEGRRGIHSVGTSGAGYPN